VAWKLGNKTTYCLEGSAFIAGAAVQWLRDGLEIIDTATDVESLATSVDNGGGVVFIPALSGMGAPHWLSEARGMILGITRGTTKAHLARATLEGIAFQIAELVEAMGKDFKKKLKVLKVDGGASQNDFLMQLQADILGVKVVRSKITEITALGSGLQAGLAIGMWKDLSEIEQKWQSAKEFSPGYSPAQRRQKMQTWNDAIQVLAHSC